MTIWAGRSKSSIFLSWRVEVTGSIFLEVHKSDFTQLCESPATNRKQAGRLEAAPKKISLHLYLTFFVPPQSFGVCSSSLPLPSHSGKPCWVFNCVFMPPMCTRLPAASSPCVKAGLSDVSWVSSGWSAVRPAAPREGAGKGQKHPSTLAGPHLSAPARVPFHAPAACFQEGLASCVMEWWRRGGKGGLGEEKADRQTEMRWCSCACRGGGSCCFQLRRNPGFHLRGNVATTDRLKPTNTFKFEVKYSNITKEACSLGNAESRKGQM